MCYDSQMLIAGWCVITGELVIVRVDCLAGHDHLYQE